MYFSLKKSLNSDVPYFIRAGHLLSRKLISHKKVFFILFTDQEGGPPPHQGEGHAAHSLTSKADSLCAASVELEDIHN